MAIEDKAVDIGKHVQLGLRSDVRAGVWVMRGLLITLLSVSRNR
jgi:hypothetical protein